MKTRKGADRALVQLPQPVVIGAISIVVIAILVFAAFNSSDLPIIGGGTVYSAEFTEAAGLRAGDEVRIAGVRVGTVDAVELEGDRRRHVSGSRTSSSATRPRRASRSRRCWGASTSRSTRGGATRTPTDDPAEPHDVAVRHLPGVPELTQTTDAINSDQLGRSLASP